VYEIDLAQMTLAATILGDVQTVGSVVLSPEGASLGVLVNGYQNQLFLIDTATGTTTQTVNMSGSIIAVGWNGNTYVQNSSSGGGFIDTIDDTTGAVTSALIGRVG